jgi:hypothetical protein
VTETSYIQRLHRKLPREIYRWKIRAAFANGIPDCYYSGSSGDLWAEYKYIPTTPKRSYTPKLSPLQKKWLNDRHQEGRAVAVIVGCPAGSTILPDRTWMSDTLVPPATWLLDEEVIEWLIRRLGCK